MKCSIIKPFLGLECNIYDSVFKKRILKYSCPCLHELSLESKLKNKNFNISVEVFLYYLSPSLFYTYSTM